MQISTRLRTRPTGRLKASSISTKIGLNNLPVKLQEIAIARMVHPEVSLKELGELVPGGPISKSGVNHRLRKIMEQAEKMGFEK